MFKKLVSFLLVILVLVNLYIIIIYLMSPIIGDDAAFYLSVSKEIYQGKIYFHEIGIPYNPLSILIMGLPYLFFETPDFRWHLLINILIIIGISYIFYKILNFFLRQRVLNLFFSSFLLLLNLTLAGEHVILEPQTIFFQLLALFFYLDFLKKFNIIKIFLVGLFISLSFLSKQYGLFILLPISLDLFFKRKKSLAYLFIGLVIPIFIFFSYLNFYGVGIVEFINCILGNGISLDYNKKLDFGKHIFSFNLKGYLYFLLFNLYLIIIPMLLKKYFKESDNNKYLFIALSLVCLSPLFFDIFFSYFRYMVPYWILLFAYLFKKIKEERYQLLCLLLLSFSILFSSSYSILSFKKDKILANRKATEAIILNKILAPGSKVYLDGLSPSYYYLCRFQSIDSKNIGFTFSDLLFPKTIINYIKPGGNIIVSKEKSFEYTDKEEFSFSSQEIILLGEDFIILTKKDE